MLNDFKLVALAGLIGLTACSGIGSGYEPVLDGPRGPHFATDLADCQALARDPRHDQDITAGAVVGAGIGAVIAAVESNSVEQAVAATLIGGAIGAAEGADAAGETRKRIITQCLRGRGHNALG